LKFRSLLRIDALLCKDFKEAAFYLLFGSRGAVPGDPGQDPKHHNRPNQFALFCTNDPFRIELDGIPRSKICDCCVVRSELWKEL